MLKSFAELCGQAHFNMRRVVVVEEESAFKQWFAAQESLYKKQVTTAEKAAPAPADTYNTTQATQEKKPTENTKKLSSL